MRRWGGVKTPARPLPTVAPSTTFGPVGAAAPGRSSLGPGHTEPEGAVMSLRVSVVCAVSALLLVRPAAAQRTGTIEVGGFLRFTDFDNSLNISNTLGFGGRLGVFVVPRVSVEAEFFTTSTDSGPNLNVKHTPFHLFGVYNHPPDARADIGGVVVDAEEMERGVFDVEVRPGVG